MLHVVSVVMKQANFAMSWTVAIEFGAETLQLITVVGGGDARICWKQLEHHHAVYVPPNAEHHLALMQFRFWFWFRFSIFVDPLMFARDVNVEDPLFVASDY